MELKQTWAQSAGVLLVLAGLAGFAVGEMLIIFGVNTLHNIVHILTGAVLAYAGFTTKALKQTLQALGAAYILVGIVGFFGVLSFLNVNTPDNFLHLGLGAVSAYLGWKK